jgi:tRNA G18 (ribose-2'-O)-methylase SpoU
MAKFMRPNRGGAGSALRSSAEAELLTSRDNRWLKEFRVALRGGVPTAAGAVGVEGVRLVEGALGSGCRVEAVLFSESGERHRERLAPWIGRPEMAFPVLRTTDRLFEGIADTEHPQGVAALVVPRVVTLEELVAGRTGNQQWAINDQEERAKESDSSGAKGHFSAGSMSKLKVRPPEEETQDRLRTEGGAPFEGHAIPPSSDEERSNADRRAQPGMAVPQAPLIVVLAGVQDPGNVGTILRTATAFGATGAVMAATGQSGTASPFAPKALRASAGAALTLPIVSGMALGILLTQLRLYGVRTLASCVEEKRSQQSTVDSPQFRRREDLGEEKPQDLPSEPFAKSAQGQSSGGAPGSGQAMAPWEVDWCQPIALLVGNEGGGLPEEVVQSADGRVSIPMAGEVESLNAAAAAAVVLYEASRQRKKV